MIMTWLKKFLLSSCDPWSNEAGGIVPHDPKCDVDPKTMTWKRTIEVGDTGYVCASCASRAKPSDHGRRFSLVIIDEASHFTPAQWAELEKRFEAKKTNEKPKGVL